MRGRGVVLGARAAIPSRAPEEPLPEPLFGRLVLSGPRGARPRPEWLASLLLHVGAGALLLLLPLALSEPLPPPAGGALRVFFYHDPPPPPPAPLPRGSGRLARPLPLAKPTPAPRADAMRAPVTPADDAVTPLAEHANADPDGGDPEGAEGGDPGGLPGGVPGGVVGGVPGGVLGGVIGGTGSGPVPVARPDRPPKPIHLPRPVYPHEAFVDKVEGTVLLEIVIDERGHVVRARVLRSVPRLDAAALEAVRSWLFVPALHQGHPVASLALAPISFSIY